MKNIAIKLCLALTIIFSSSIHLTKPVHADHLAPSLKDVLMTSLESSMEVTGKNTGIFKVLAMNDFLNKSEEIIKKKENIGIYIKWGWENAPNDPFIKKLKQNDTLSLILDGGFISASPEFIFDIALRTDSDIQTIVFEDIKELLESGFSAAGYNIFPVDIGHKMINTGISEVEIKDVYPIRDEVSVWGETDLPDVKLKVGEKGFFFPETERMTIEGKELLWESEDEGIAIIKGQKIKPVGLGTTTLNGYLENEKIEVKVVVENVPEEDNSGSYDYDDGTSSYDSWDSDDHSEEEIVDEDTSSNLPEEEIVPEVDETSYRLERGSRGSEVTQLQNMLNELGYSTGVDGIYGPNTESRVSEFQAGYNLEKSGSVDDPTWNKLVERSIDAAYSKALKHFNNGVYKEAMTYAHKAIEFGGDQEAQDLVRDSASELLGNANQLQEDGDRVTAINEYETLVSISYVPTDIQSAAQKSINTIKKDSDYGEAQWYYNEGSYFNAVHYTSQAITYGYDVKESREFLDQAAQKLITVAYDKNEIGDRKKAVKWFTKVQDTSYVSADIRNEAKSALNTIKKGSSFGEAQWYYNEGSYYNAVHYTLEAMEFGYDVEESRIFLEKASQKLLNEAYDKNENGERRKAVQWFNKLASTSQIPDDIQQEAKIALQTIEEATSYGEAQWYYGEGDYSNAVYYSVEALEFGYDVEKTRNLLEKSSQKLLNEAYDKNKNGEQQKAVQWFMKLAKISYLNDGIRNEAKAALQTIEEASSYGEAQWYFNEGNYYNAVYYADEAIKFGYDVPKTQKLLATASSELLRSARLKYEEGDSKTALSWLSFLVNVSGNVKEEAKNLIEVIESDE